MKDLLKKINDFAIWIAIFALIGVALIILYYPSGQAYLRCEKNAPLLTQYEECVNKSADFYPSFQCINRHGAGLPGVNWSVLNGT